MNGLKHTILKDVLSGWPDGGVMTSERLRALGVSPGLARNYAKAGWVRRIGRGAYAKFGQRPELEALVAALPADGGTHLGGRSALSRRGVVHFVPLGEGAPETLFAARGTRLPSWFASACPVPFRVVRTDFLPAAAGVETLPAPGGGVRVSSPERALLEALQLVPKRQSLAEVWQWLEAMPNLRPSHLQSLLEACRSIKAKRLFLMLADAAGHAWLKRLDLSRVKLGSGCRQIEKDGRLEARYGVVVKPWRYV